MHVLTLTPAYAVALCVVISFIFVVLKVVYNIALHPLSHYPGPKIWGATRLTWVYALQSGRLHHRIHEMHQKYGPVIRIAPNELSYINSQAWNDIHQSRPGHVVIPKNEVWSKDPPGSPQSVLTVHEGDHTRARRALMGAFTEHAIMEHAPILEGLVDLMIRKFRDIAVAEQTSRRVVDLGDWLNFLIFDISGALALGDSFHSVANSKAHPWVEITYFFGRGLAFTTATRFFKPLDKLLYFVLPKDVRRKMQYHRDLVHEKFHERIRMVGKEKSQDYVGSMMQYNERKGEIAISMAEQENNMEALIFAGSEPASTSLVSIVHALMRNVGPLQKAAKEVRDTFQSEADINVASVSKLEYLTAVIQEGIRLGPAFAVNFPRIIPKGGERICEQHVPAGTFVSVTQYAAYRSTTHFSQPDAFIPERFLQDSPFPTDNLAVYQPFLTGRHKCLGQKLAWAEMRLILARLLYDFDMSPLEHLPDFGERNTYVFWEKKPLLVRLTLRETTTI